MAKTCTNYFKTKRFRLIVNTSDEKKSKTFSLIINFLVFSLLTFGLFKTELDACLHRFFNQFCTESIYFESLSVVIDFCEKYLQNLTVINNYRYGLL